MLVLEKNTGQVQRVVNGAVQATVLDLAVNFGSERGLLGIALHPDFPANPGVYLYWTESTTGADTNVLSATPLLGNRVDRFVWNGSTLTLRPEPRSGCARSSRTHDGTTPGTQQPERGNHDGGVIAFGADGKLYVFIGDVGRRGQLQNLPCGPTATCPGRPSRTTSSAGPQPDDAHLAGVVLRLNDDGTTPDRQSVLRRRRGDGWRGRREHPEDLLVRASATASAWRSTRCRARSGCRRTATTRSDELNLVEPGMNGGWVQIIGPGLAHRRSTRRSRRRSARGLPEPAAAPLAA